MKILGMLPKWAMVTIIAIVVVTAYMAVTPAYTFDEEAPTATMSIRVEEVGGETYVQDNIQIEPSSQLAKIMTSYPLTTYDAGIPPLNPTGVYTISFAITAKTTSASQTETFSTYAVMSGHQDRTIYASGWPSLAPANYVATWVGDSGEIAESAPKAATNGAEVTLAVPTFSTINVPIQSGTVNRVILGSDIDGSIFGLNVISSSASGGFGQTTVEVRLVVGGGGDLEVEITQITTNVG